MQYLASFMFGIINYMTQPLLSISQPASVAFSAARDRKKRERRPGPKVVTSWAESTDPAVVKQKNYLLRSWRNLPRWATVPLEKSQAYLVVGKEHDSFRQIENETGMPLTQTTAIDSPRVKLSMSPNGPIPIIAWPLKGKIFGEIPDDVKAHPRLKKPLKFERGHLQQYILAEEVAHSVDGVFGLISQKSDFFELCRRDIASQPRRIKNQFQQLVLSQPEHRTLPNEIFARVMSPLILGKKPVSAQVISQAEASATRQTEKNIPTLFPQDSPDAFFGTIRAGFPSVENYIKTQVIPYLKSTLKQ